MSQTQAGDGRLQHEAAPRPAADGTHLTVRALSMVSAVVKVLETTTAMVVAGSRLFSARATSTGSTFARNRSVRPRDASAAAWRQANQRRETSIARPGQSSRIQPPASELVPTHSVFTWSQVASS